jgi:hypothetical protein
MKEEGECKKLTWIWRGSPARHNGCRAESSLLDFREVVLRVAVQGDLAKPADRNGVRQGLSDIEDIDGASFSFSGCESLSSDGPRGEVASRAVVEEEVRLKFKS